MGKRIKYLISFILLLKLSDFLSQGIEEQRKYIMKDAEAFETSLKINPTIGGITLLHHGDDTYFDLYLDSPDFILKRNGLCLRFRKRISMENGLSYSFQLKNEMRSENSIRMEIEESDLAFYQFVQDSEIVNLTDILDPIFDFADSKILSENTTKCLETLEKWISFKAGSSILPFQQLRSINDSLFSQQTICTLNPVLAGKSNRSRFHGVLDPTQNDSLYKLTIRNQKSIKQLPLTLQKNTALNWIFEASFDKSEFVLFDEHSEVIKLTEFEIENKFFIPETGTHLMDVFQEIAEQKYNLKTGKASKYVQAIQRLYK